ncbi:unnamed protein product [Musa acuminata var. zebrina]
MFQFSGVESTDICIYTLSFAEAKLSHGSQRQKISKASTAA